MGRLNNSVGNHLVRWLVCCGLEIREAVLAGRLAVVAAATCLGFVPFESVAVNGTRAIAYGAESAQLAGSDVASGKDVSVVVTNPANLSQISRHRFDGGGVAVITGDTHRDSLGNDQRVDNVVTPILALGYGQRIQGSRVVFGAGAFVHGGAGAVYKDLITPVGSRDEYSSRYAVLMLGLGASYEVTELLALGISVEAVHGRAEQKLFPNVSVASPQYSYFGLEVNDAKVTRTGLRLGMRYRLNEDVVLGGYAASKVDLPMEGSAVADLSAVGLGKARYASVQINGLGVPPELAVGVAWKVSETAELSGKVERVFWSRVYRTVTYLASRPELPFAPPELQLSSDLRWSDQTVFALGATFVQSADLTLRAGINIGTAPGQPETTSPLISGIDRFHLTFGFSRRIAAGYEVLGGFEYLIPESLTYTNPQQPFGPDSFLERRYIAVHLAVARRW